MDPVASKVAARFQATNDVDQTPIRVAARFTLTLPRPAYLPPAARDVKPLTPDGTDLAIYVWDQEVDTPLKGKVTRYNAIAFAGKANKPLWNYVFRDDAQRQRQIDETVKSRRSLMEYKQKRVQERKDFQHSYQVGDILVSSWGYEQTNIDFYEVVGVVGTMVAVREVESKLVRSEVGSDYVVAVPGRYTGPVLKRKVGLGDSVKITDSQRAHKWDGKPERATAAGYGH